MGLRKLRLGELRQLVPVKEIGSFQNCRIVGLGLRRVFGVQGVQRLLILRVRRYQSAVVMRPRHPAVVEASVIELGGRPVELLVRPVAMLLAPMDVRRQHVAVEITLTAVDVSLGAATGPTIDAGESALRHRRLVDVALTRRYCPVMVVREAVNRARVIARLALL